MVMLYDGDGVEFGEEKDLTVLKERRAVVESVEEGRKDLDHE